VVVVVVVVVAFIVVGFIVLIGSAAVNIYWVIVVVDVDNVLVLNVDFVVNIFLEDLGTVESKSISFS